MRGHPPSVLILYPAYCSQGSTVDPGIDAAVKIFLVSPKMNKPSYNKQGCIEPLAVNLAS
jgi:hypothetical protein